MASGMDSQLSAVAIVERDLGGECTVVWTFAALPFPDVFPRLLVQRSTDAYERDTKFVAGRYKTHWHYTVSVTGGLPTAKLSKVNAFSLHVVSKVFNPEKFRLLAQVLASRYYASGEPTKVLEGWLQAFTLGECAAGGSAWKASAFDDKMAKLTDCSLKGMIRLFGEESIFLWTAMLLRKRILVYSDQMGHLLRVVRTIPQLAWLRQEWDILRPYIAGRPEELEELKEAGVYVAGTTNEALRDSPDLYDVYVDVPGRRVLVPEHAKGDFVLLPMHREVATVMLKGAASEEPEQAVIKIVAQQNQQLVARLKMLAGDAGAITMDMLKAKGYSASITHFLYSMAQAEKLSA